MFNKRIKGHSVAPSKRPDMVSEDELWEFLESAPDENEGVIYIHVPFCDNICSFCSMNRTKLEDELDEYTKFLLSEIEKYSATNYLKSKKIGSVYFGGGTPTILKERHLEQVINALKGSFNILPECEFSLESTLHNLNISKLRLLNEFGVNRYSIGVQTFSEAGRKLLNRTHSSDGAIKHLRDLREKFSGMLCVDIIYNYPNESIDEVVRDAKLVRELGIDSASFYSLQFLDGSVLSKTISEDYYDVEVDKSLHHAFLDEILSQGDYEILEYTKVAKKGRDQYKYIRLSHVGADVLPLGKGAGGRLGEFGIYNMSQKMKVMGRMTARQMEFDKFVNLFQYPQISLECVFKFVSQTCANELMDLFKKCEESGYLKIKNDSLNFTKDGVFWGNSIANAVMEISKKEFL
ncbi:radical SAM protein [Campylobacter concisus]|jgi:quinone-reactive Ni/Fe hydrogenase, large subunit|uniref:radical SAM protein n=1 Tax=Campylobacter concisus TaxID=199 RepID=UPI000A0405C3|nr:radical SAM protein [Campylobacter concisus]ORI07508.1 coproporphyrinogen III oxidase [Campylobacter concisus]